jgi:uncharacterized protein
MKAIIKCIAIVVFTFSVFAASGQVNDSADRERLELYRQLFWDHLPKPTGWVNDLERLYTRKELYSLDSIIDAFEKQTTIEIGIVTLDTFCTSLANFTSLSAHLMNTWGVGKKDVNNGLLVSISAEYHMIHIDYGPGLDSLMKDADAQEIVDKNFIPGFKNEDYYGGTLNGLNGIIKLLNSRKK